MDLKNYTESENIFKRKAVRGIISRNGKYLFIYSKYGDYKFPGGGMEEGETLEMTLFREVSEETGYIVKKSSIKEGFEVLERRRGDPEDILEMKSYYYFCEVEDDTTDRNLDDYEKEYDYKVSWLTLEEAISKNESVEDFENIPWIVRETMVMKNLHNTISNTYIGRVVSQLKDMYKVIVEDVIIYAEVSGKFSYNTTKVTDYPVVGDFVKLDRNSDKFGNAIIHEVLPRKSLFIRMASGTGNKEQAVAANIDYVFICMSLNLDFNLKRLERYITLSFESGAVPVVVLTKADLCEDVPSALRDVKSVAIGVDILLTSSFEDGGLEELEPYLKKDKTIALIGSSGVGKSTLINRLSNNNDLETNILRNDDKGKHTTTRREMHFLPGGAVIIDTPGMREIGITSEVDSFDKSFNDIEKYFSKCKFSNCTHTKEPGCAVLRAIEEGEISEKRWDSYNKLKKETEFSTDKEGYIRKKNTFFKEISKINKGNLK